MTQRVLGPTGSPRRHWSVLLLLAAALAVGVVYVAGAGAEPGNGDVFELDASLDPGGGGSPQAAVTDNTANALPDDWDRICHTATITADTTNSIPNQCLTALDDHATARSFDTETNADGTANNASIFTGGGSKDQAALADWKWKDASGGLPDKDNLLNAMAARYSATNQYIFFGADRFDNSGDAQIGFWFFNNQVCLKSDGTFGTGPAATCSGTAVHKSGEVPHNPANTGDILVLSDFTNGGTQPTIRVFEYVGSGGSDGSLNLLGGTETDIRDCGVVPTDDFCGSVNNFDGTTAPWLFKNKSNQTTYGHGEFYEGGLNLNFFGLQNECFSSFAAETRSSQSVTATLKDFVLGGFQQCTASMTTLPKLADGTTTATTVSPGTPVHDLATIVGSNATKTPSSPPNVFFRFCSFAVGSTATCSTSSSGVALSNSALSGSGGTATATSSEVNTAANPLAPGHYCFFASWAGDTNYPGTLDADGALECFDVTVIPSSVSTAQNWIPNDKATISTTGPAGYDLTGSVTFSLYGPNDTSCAGSPVYQETFNMPAGAGLTEDFNTTNGDGVGSGLAADFKVTKANEGTYSWKVVYTPAAADTAHTGNNSACNAENTAVDITEP